jgi:uncharacterized protein (DUF169 family)
MDMVLKADFIRLWRKYFNNAALPLTFYYTGEEGRAEGVKAGEAPRCLIAALVKVRQGSSLSFDAEAVGCTGGKRYLGFADQLAPDFEYFLSCGIPGKVRGERYKKSPEIVKAILERWPKFKAPARYIVFKRWDNLEAADSPAVVIFWANPDVLSGLYTLANFDEADPEAVIAPMGSGCSTIVQDPYMEKDQAHPRAVLGMFDISARPFVSPDELSLAVPMNKFIRMVRNMEESFLINDAWKAIRTRIG